jgi:hypothetical protein
MLVVAHHRSSWSACDMASPSMCFMKPSSVNEGGTDQTLNPTFIETRKSLHILHKGGRHLVLYSQFHPILFSSDKRLRLLLDPLQKLGREPGAAFRLRLDRFLDVRAQTADAAPGPDVRAALLGRDLGRDGGEEFGVCTEDGRVEEEDVL